MAQSMQKKRCDIKLLPQEFAVGDKILNSNSRKDTQMGDKLTQRFHGPCSIMFWTKEIFDKIRILK